MARARLVEARLLAALVLVTLVAALECWGGLRANSLALLSDAAHVAMDVLALGVAFAAAVGAQRPVNRRKTFGYGRLEMLGALFNSALLLAVTGVILYAAAWRFVHPPVTRGALMSGIAAVGLIVNTGVAVLLRGHARRSLNLRAALFHVVGDALGALAVIVGGLVILATAWRWVDPLLSIVVCALIVAGVYRVMRDAADVLLEAAPAGVDLAEVAGTMADAPGVVAVHDLHLWTVGSAQRVLSAHVVVSDSSVREATAILRGLETLLRERYAVTHVTLQFECESCAPDEAILCIERPIEG